MAVLSKIEVTVSVNGEKAQEFDAAEEVEENTVVKYIEAITDASFSFDFVLHPGYKPKCDYLSFVTFIDGQWVHGEVFDKSDYPRTKHSDPVISDLDGIWSKDSYEWIKQGFKFSDLSLGELNEGDEKDPKCIPQFGTMRVDVWRKRLTHKTKEKDSHKFLPRLDVPEKRVKGKALSHAANLYTLETKKSRDADSYNGKPLDAKPVAVFVFKYRSKKALQDLMIIPRSPSPPPLEERPIDSLTMEEMKELLVRQRAQLSTTVKREREEESPVFSDSVPSSKRPREELGDPPSRDLEYTSSRLVESVAGDPIDLTD